MDDTAFHYSRTLRIIMVLAIVVPLLGISLLLWYFSSVDVPEAIGVAGEGVVVNAVPNDPDAHVSGLTLAPDGDEQQAEI